MKKIINAPTDVIEDYIHGLVGALPHLARVEGWPVVVRSSSTRKANDRVALVTGGGSGHEPAHAGYVGAGMLDAAVLGPVFTSPSVDAVYAAIRAVATDAGVLLIVKNYTGDRLNFGLAAEMARADGVRVETVVVADDAALGDTAGAGRRGLTSTVLVHKVAGAAAERGWPIERIVAVLDRLLEGAATMGVGLGPCHVPGASAANFELGADEVEWGLGIHGEPGRERGPLVSSREVARELVTRVVADRGIPAGAEVAVLVNSLGGTPDLELRILQGDVFAELARLGIRPRLSWAGPFLTSLDMPGASVTLAVLDDELAELLTDDHGVAAFPRTIPATDLGRPEAVPAPTLADRAEREVTDPAAVAALDQVAARLARVLIDAEEELTALDRRVGDGDLGINLARGARAVLDARAHLQAESDASGYLRAVSQLVRHHVGGTSGPLYSILLLGMAESLEGAASPGADAWAGAFAAGVSRLRDIGGAAPGDRTMVDALVPAADAATAGHEIRDIAAAARTGAEGTAAISANLGRSSYVGDRVIGTPDPGAIAVAALLEGLAAVGTDSQEEAP
ncbi:dihydroxyacetone kinase family protein [Microbacterium album]|uniref:Dihydroxyacetone kinase n=1 Tax=Microbacterium album TaxID=2053191 RepID=A0A917IJB3_9MICO|nr:dihydroxyacetone kinase family protein [Microbacterium album]GGH49428.1 dihydroxyacetone kinase [Microbacterium album]